MYCQSVSLTIILPTLNEAQNIGTLLKRLLIVFSDLPQFQILVIDDLSTDGTQKEVERIAKLGHKVRLIVRDNPDGLTGAIKFGLSLADSDYIGWMDADGSMPADALLKLWLALDKTTDLIVGSRFVPGGGFKGVTSANKNFRTIYKNLKQSNDSITAMFLSRILNLYLRIVLSNRIKDYTSGFIIIRSNKLVLSDLKGYYGEYCPVFLFKSLQKGLRILEVPYINLPREHGVSKTGTNLISLVKTGTPYLTSALKVRLKLI